MAAYDTFGIATTDWLIDAAHKALDDGVYTPDLGHLATVRDPTLYECLPLFRSALQDLGVPMPDPITAILTLLDFHVTETAEGVTRPAEMLEKLYAITQGVRYDPRMKVPPAAFEPLDPFLDLYYPIDMIEGELSYQIELGIPTGDDLGLETLYAEAEALALGWCRKKWQPALEPAWRTSAVVGLSLGIDADKAFARLPVLADALEDAGCSDESWLSHLRDGNPHASRCCLVDILLDGCR